ERKELRLKKEKEQELKQNKRNGFFNAYAEMLKNEDLCEKVWELVKKEDFEDTHVRHIEKQVNDIKEEQLSALRKNTTLSNEEFSLVCGGMYSPIIFRDEMKYQLGLPHNKVPNPSKFRKYVRVSLDGIKKSREEIKEYLSSANF
ncbi:unnamed protein product, partial [marine sediment metagenome]